MSFIAKYYRKLKSQLLHLRLQPIRVFCFHQTSNIYDPFTCIESDWMSMSVFKHKIKHIQEEYTFIPLSCAYKYIKNDWFRKKKYAVLTADDGYRSICNIIPWLQSQSIPITLFINAKYLDGKSYSNHLWKKVQHNDSQKTKEEWVSDVYISDENVFELDAGGVEFASHGFEHLDGTLLTDVEFASQIENNIRALEKYRHYIPFHAYTWGHYNNQMSAFLRYNHIIPVLIDGAKNYNDSSVIHRELL